MIPALSFLHNLWALTATCAFPTPCRVLIAIQVPLLVRTCIHSSTTVWKRHFVVMRWNNEFLIWKLFQLATGMVLQMEISLPLFKDLTSIERECTNGITWLILPPFNTSTVNFSSTEFSEIYFWIGWISTRNVEFFHSLKAGIASIPVISSYPPSSRYKSNVVNTDR